MVCSLEGEIKVKADELVEKFTALGCPDPLIWTRSELEENNPSLAEFRFLAFLKKSLTYYDQNQESIVQGLSERGMPHNEITTLLKYYTYAGMSEVFGRLKH